MAGPFDPATPPSPRQRRTLRRRGLQKSPGATCRLLKILQNTRGLMEILSRFSRKNCSAGEASTVRTSPFCERANVGNTARGASIPAKPDEKHATAVVDDVRGHEERRAGRESTSGAESTRSRRKPGILPKVTLELSQNMYPLSNKALRDNKKRQLRKLHRSLPL